MNKKLAEQIIEMRNIDQDLRTQASKKVATELINYIIYAVDEVHNSRIKRIVAEHGFPTDDLVGREAMSAFWLLIQHQDYDLGLQQEALERCDFVPNERALLTDRILINKGKKQIYGTQTRRTESGFEPFPIEDEVSVNERRKNVGLSSLDEYMRERNS
ncbi:MAG: hypothetical protein A2735_03425 [Candidatus Yanofskybacteria bacterium RIFCSPHIGHO2_01_FULL_41_21]|uniref:Uncharacterized protein n=1 Tax=Candidatus Yanofskybacteria bacterium RIFCSPHIGHO2_01_FULL_41_21 TaxID=1802660 RepID=A0A1F8EA62_9BACT|nr:MAG: hypothetical protein A2735_03425 [Candidatus Yanofskybacteria bacterium RIFCSPHIGHO2_01_FULL_41_21]